MYRGADKSLARPTFRCILFDDENISFDASLVIYDKIKDRKRSLSRKKRPQRVVELEKQPQCLVALQKQPQREISCCG